MPKQNETVPPPTIDPNAPLSEKLKESEGVIKPPAAIDPEIRMPPPDDAGRSNMPVIIPPGEPGGDQSVQPK